MSKITKLIKNPVLFFQDRKKRIVKQHLLELEKEKPAAKKPAAKKPEAKKPAAKKTVAKKTTTKK